MLLDGHDLSHERIARTGQAQVADEIFSGYGDLGPKERLDGVDPEHDLIEHRAAQGVVLGQPFTCGLDHAGVGEVIDEVRTVAERDTDRHLDIATRRRYPSVGINVVVQPGRDQRADERRARCEVAGTADLGVDAHCDEHAEPGDDRAEQDRCGAPDVDDVECERPGFDLAFARMASGGGTASVTGGKVMFTAPDTPMTSVIEVVVRKQDGTLAAQYLTITVT